MQGIKMNTPNVETDRFLSFLTMRIRSLESLHRTILSKDI